MLSGATLTVAIPGQQPHDERDDLLVVAERALEPGQELEPEPEQVLPGALIPPQSKVEEVASAEAPSVFRTLSPRSEQVAAGSLKSDTSLDAPLSAEQAARTVRISRIPIEMATRAKLATVIRSSGCPDPTKITFCPNSYRTAEDKEHGLHWALATFGTADQAGEVLAATLDKTGRQHLRCAMVDRQMLAAMTGAALGNTASLHGMALGGSTYVTPSCQIDPQGKFKRRWDLVLTVLCIYIAMFVPYRVGFQIELCPGDLDWSIEAFVDAFFVLDIILTFRTPLITNTGHIERSPKLIRKAYAQSWFLVDVLAVLPVSYVALIVSGERCSGVAGSTRMFKVVRLIRLAKLLRLAKLREVVRLMVSDIDALEDSYKYIKIFGAMLAIAYVCHLFACMWYYFGTFGQDAGVSASGGWVEHAGIGAASTDIKYLWSVYWAITVLSTVGYGDVVAHTNAEKAFSIVAELFGCIIFATLIGSLGSIMMSKKLLDQKVEYQLEELREYGRVKGLPKSLQKRMRLILEDAYRETAFDENKVLAQLPAAVQREVREHIFQVTLEMMPLFQNLPETSNEVLKQLLVAFKPLVVQPFDPVYEENSPAFDFFVIISGEITLTKQGADESRVLQKGAFFGERELFYSKRFGSGGAVSLPLVGRKRHQTAIVTSRVRAELKFLSWPQVMALRRTSRPIFEKIREAALIRAEAEVDFKAQEQRRNVLDTMFVQYDAQNFSAKVIQRRWRAFSSERAAQRIAVQSDRQLLETLVLGMARTTEQLDTLEKRMVLLEQDRGSRGT